MKHVVIAIDGFSSSGKSTLAKHLAKKLDYQYVDSGAFYRAVTYFLLRNNVDWNKEQPLNEALRKVQLGFRFDLQTGICETLLNGINVESEIRSLEVSKAASEVSAIPSAREFVTSQLRKFAEGKNIVMDGRDIGTVVFPNADLKIYMIADPKIRSERRFREMRNRGDEVTETQIEKNLSGRDLLDTTRSTAPLKKAENAIELDNTNLNEEQQLNFVLDLFKKKFNSTE
jgi:cytidylate kinase